MKVRMKLVVDIVSHITVVQQVEYRYGDFFPNTGNIFAKFHILPKQSQKMNPKKNSLTGNFSQIEPTKFVSYSSLAVPSILTAKPSSAETPLVITFN